MDEDQGPYRSSGTRLLIRLMRYLRPYWASAVGAFAAIIAVTALQLVLPYLTKVAIDKHIATHDPTGLGRIALLFFCVIVITFGLEYLQTCILQTLGQRITRDLRLVVFQHLQALSINFYDHTPVGRLMTRVTTDVEALNDLFAAGLVNAFGDAFLLLGIVVGMVVMDLRLALLVLCMLPLIGLATRWARKQAQERYRGARVLTARLNSFLQEHLTGMGTVQLFRQERRVLEQFKDTNRQYRQVYIGSTSYFAAFYSTIEFIGILSIALILWQGGSWVMHGTLTLGTLVAFLQYTRRFFQPISDLSEKFNLLQAAMASSERIFALLDEPVENDELRFGAPAEMEERSPQGTSRYTKTDQPQIAFEHVSFAYDGTSRVLNDVSFTVSRGERVGIVGSTGSGKTTLLHLLMRFYDVQNGRILLDGVDLREIGLDTLRSRFGIVPQDVHLFSGTIDSNIRLGRHEIPGELVRRAARTVYADRFIEKLPHGYETVVAERGTNLSAGEKQLLSLARAFVSSPQILLLDEATSSIDTETESLVRKASETLMADRTTIAVAHRLSTIQNMDKILVLHRGTLREVGTHQQLMAKRGIYYTLYQFQYRDQELFPNPLGLDGEWAPTSSDATDQRHSSNEEEIQR